MLGLVCRRSQPTGAVRLAARARNLLPALWAADKGSTAKTLYATPWYNKEPNVALYAPWSDVEHRIFRVLSFVKANVSARQPDATVLQELYSDMELIRQVELRLSTMFAGNQIPGFIHSSIGQEAVAVGVIRAMQSSDTLVSTHRGHGHCVSRGLGLEKLFQEILGREAGVCKGRGGSMHIADASLGMLGANGIVGAGVPIALGSALAQKTRKSKAVAVAFFGDGALGEGVIYECMNLASLWDLPLLFVCEHNGWSEFTPSSKEYCGDLISIAAGFHIPGNVVDGSDVWAVNLAAKSALDAVRSGGRPQLLVCMAQRIRGHFEGDPQRYRDRSDIERAQARDPITRALEELHALGVPTDTTDAIRARSKEAVQTAAEAAQLAPEPAICDLVGAVYFEGAV